MNYGSSSRNPGTRNRRGVEYGRTYVVRPKGRHLATIVWLHGLRDNGSRIIESGQQRVPNAEYVKSWSQVLESLSLPNIKWICPTAPTRPVAMFGGFPCTAWFDVGEITLDGPDDLEGVDDSAAHIANLLSAEPAGIKLGIGGFSMGAATALYSATCFASGRYGNTNPYPIYISAAVGLSGWLPCSRSLKSKMDGSYETARRAASLPIMLCHGKGDDVVAYKNGEKSARIFNSTGFRNLTFKSYNELGHYTVPGEMDDVCKWLTARLGLDGSP